jgi:hypothetical protein
MDLLPGASLEFRVYVLLGIVGVMFFAAILALGVGRLVAMRSSSNVSNIADTPNSPFGTSYDEPKKEASKREKKAKQVKVKKEKMKTADEIFQEDSFEEEAEPERKISFFGKKKKDAVEMLAKPSGYVDEYAPTHTRETND